MEISSFPDASATSWMPSYVGLWTMDQAAPAQRAYVVSTSMPQPLRESASRRGDREPMLPLSSILRQALAPALRRFWPPAAVRPATPVSGEPLSTAYPAGRACRPGLCGAWRPWGSRAAAITWRSNSYRNFGSGLSGVSSCWGTTSMSTENRRTLTPPWANRIAFSRSRSRCMRS